MKNAVNLVRRINVYLIRRALSTAKPFWKLFCFTLDRFRESRPNYTTTVRSKHIALAGIFGLYNKLVKLEGDNKSDRGRDNYAHLAPEDEANAARLI